jgi:hypothetical protein
VFGDDLKPFLPNHIQKFSEQLKQFPKHYEKWVHASSLTEQIYQGDVMAQAPLVAINEKGDADRLDLPGMVISCTCDVQPDRGDIALVAPVLDLEDYRNNSELEGQALEDHIKALTENKISDFFFLPPGLGLTAPSFVDFGSITSVSVEYLHSDDRKNRLTSLSLLGHYFFVVKLAYHFTRPEGADSMRL